MKYQWILFDADETLFSFNSFLGLKVMMERYGVPFNEQDYEQFQAVNKPLWVAYQNKEITAQDLQRIRFEKIAQQTGQEPLALNHELMAEMALLSQPLENVREMLDSLFGKVKMAIITNGFQALQQKRLENTRLNKYFDVVVVSETVGAAKPAPQIFESAFAQMRHVDKHAILMVGDTLSSDVQGGINVGIDTCWFNPTKQPNSTTIQPTYEIAEILDLVKIVSG
ncbi:pyrimidine 5'-nucleotidase [Ursidibacter maritimus]|uniref:Pyrimidine 5'-nucleotidase n=1 Tax=Ursidibacter maritimus TaxID=1331689 RepID=A0A949WPU4_9PAST|nr:pyrimidine 5'-nucleotidase [Ursidibacter maritimus]KAE9542146.1 dUMP phosphatase [Ursidibacter maritimus]MBV6524216.1 pyrimidine 5'-nucleotidase [Ursidibacter maritimus]MBV6525164.1 pyrimidine 5'-nucleotidase [Ursidibacter maritimus]MBV6528427.1 pyrimidine 5'-nucleotidase [Ursidibacter maritimus]MBV6530057.1 pyrimidine 5'-nucleotidase [Ursidibacter maritimus]